MNDQQNYVAATPSPVPPTPPPTRSPLPPSLQFPRPIETVGNNGLPAAAYPLDSCLGDCDNDSECQPGLYCFQRAGGEDVPGCIGGAEDSGNNDYCFQRPSNYLWKMGNNWVPEDRFPLGKEPYMYGDNIHLHMKKCLTSYSICFDPIFTGECEGDCDKDGDCGPGLKCFQRDDEPVAGCVGAGQSGIDYCWDYTLSEQPTLSPSVSPTPKVRVLSPSSSNRYSLITLVLISSTLPHPSAYLYLFTAHVKSINDSDAIT